MLEKLIASKHPRCRSNSFSINSSSLRFLKVDFSQSYLSNRGITFTHSSAIILPHTPTALTNTNAILSLSLSQILWHEQAQSHTDKHKHTYLCTLSQNLTLDSELFFFVSVSVHKAARVTLSFIAKHLSLKKQ